MTAAPPAGGGPEERLADRVAWHDLECGGYASDLPLWRELAREAAGPVLDVGAGTGRVALDLARDGAEVVAVDRDPAVLAALEARAGDLPVRAVHADARALPLHGGRDFALVLAPMQTVQLLGGRAGRAEFLAGAAASLRPGGRVALALTDALEPFGASGPLPLPDVAERDGWVLSSQPVEVRAQSGRWIIERVRLVAAPDGRRVEGPDAIALDAIAPDALEAEARVHGLAPLARRRIEATREHVGSEVVVLARG